MTISIGNIKDLDSVCFLRIPQIIGLTSGFTNFYVFYDFEENNFGISYRTELESTKFGYVEPNKTHRRKTIEQIQSILKVEFCLHIEFIK